MSPESVNRPFRVLGIQQVAVGAPDRSALRHLWVALLGLEPVSEYRSVTENVDEEILKVGPAAWPVEVDLMQPLDPDARPMVDTPPLNHIGLWVDDLKTAVAWLARQGVRFAPGGIRKGAAGHEVCFIHPKGNATASVGGQGVLIELVQAPTEVIRRHDELGQ